MSAAAPQPPPPPVSSGGASEGQGHAPPSGGAPPPSSLTKVQPVVSRQDANAFLHSMGSDSHTGFAAGYTGLTRAQAVLYHPAMVGTLTFVGLWLVSFFALWMVRPGVVTKQVPDKSKRAAGPQASPPMRTVFAAGKAAGIAAAVAALGTGVPLFLQLRKRKPAR